MNAIGILIGILGLIAAFVFYRKSLILKKPMWGIRTKSIVTNFISEIAFLNIKYRNKQVKNLSFSRLIFWNDGKNPIDNNDISDHNPLGIYVVQEEILILDAKIIEENSSASRIKINLHENKKCINIDFEYLNSNKGFVIELVHTGISSNDLVIKGDIKGVDRMIKVPYRRVERFWFANILFRFIRNNKTRRRINAIYSLIFAGMTFWLLSYVMYNPEKGNWNSVVIFATSCALLPILHAIRTWRIVIPTGLEKFEEDF